MDEGEDLLEDWVSLGHDVIADNTPEPTWNPALPFRIGILNHEGILVTELLPIHMKFNPVTVEWADVHTFRMTSIQVLTHLAIFHENRLWIIRPLIGPIQAADTDTVRINGGKIPFTVNKGESSV